MPADQLSQVFAALADPTRRGIVARLSEGDASVAELAAPYDVSVQAISKHLKVLEGAGLILRSPHPEDGRAVLASITPRGRAVMDQATAAIVGARFALGSLTEDECNRLTDLLAPPRTAAGDF